MFTVMCCVNTCNTPLKVGAIFSIILILFLYNINSINSITIQEFEAKLIINNIKQQSHNNKLIAHNTNHHYNNHKHNNKDYNNYDNFNIGNNWFCRDKDCPPFTNKNISNLFETRVYNSNITFLYTTIRGRSLEYATIKGYYRLRRYINGNNTDKIKLPMTVPITTSVQLGLANNNYTISYFLPFKYQSNPPKPLNNSNLYLFTTNYTITLAVRSFSGFANTKTALDELQDLQDILDSTGVKYNPHYWLLAVYDGPKRIFDRHNEVALVLEQ